MTHAQIISILKDTLRIRLDITSHHGERDEIHGAKITEASIQEAAEKISAAMTSAQGERNE